MFKWSKNKSKEEVLNDLKVIFDKHGVSKVLTKSKEFWTGGEIVTFVIDSDNVIDYELLNCDLDDYLCNEDEYPNGGSSGMALDINEPLARYELNNKILKCNVIYIDGKWVI